MNQHDINTTNALMKYFNFVVLASNPHYPQHETDDYITAAANQAARLSADSLPLRIKTPHFLITVSAIEDES